MLEMLIKEITAVLREIPWHKATVSAMRRTLEMDETNDPALTDATRRALIESRIRADLALDDYTVDDEVFEFVRLAARLALRARKKRDSGT